eukprot:m.279004 g.279004  ORF g.279004 m.279004 type:complete len:216 (-) comp54893_c3_seq25:116-763(-)
MAVPATVMYYTGYDHLKEALTGHVAKDLIPLVAGPLSRGIVVTVVAPLEMVRTKMQATHAAFTYKDLLGRVEIAFASDGYRSLFRGLGATLLRDVPFSGIYWSGYEYVKGQLSSQCVDQPTPFRIAFVSGLLSGTVAATLTLPFDVVKTFQQSRIGELAVDGQPIRESVRDLMREIVRKDGLRGLFIGPFSLSFFFLVPFFFIFLARCHLCAMIL